MAKECGRTPAQVALNWLLQQPGVTSPIVGARTVEQLTDNLGACDFQLSVDQISRLSRVSSNALPFPHSFIHNPRVQAAISAQTEVEPKMPELDAVE